MKSVIFLAFLSIFSVANASYELDACIDYCYDTIEQQDHLKACVKQCAQEYPTFSYEKNFCETYEECETEPDFPLF